MSSSTETFDSGTIALNQVITKRETPQIAGSSAGFVALIVCLIIVILVSCTAIFYLLRNHEPTDLERAARRQRRYGHQSIPSSSSFTYDPSSTPAPKGWFSGLASIFSRTTNGSTSSKTRQKPKGGEISAGSTAGWVQAGSGDEWDSESGDEAMVNDGKSKQFSKIRGSRVSAEMFAVAVPSPLGTPRIYGQPQDSPFIPPRMNTADSISSHYDAHAITGFRSYNSRSDSPSPLPSVVQSPSSPVTSPHQSIVGETLTSPTSARHITIAEPSRTFSPEPLSSSPGTMESSLATHRHQDSLETDPRKWSLQSDVSARTLATGTKFYEAL